MVVIRSAKTFVNFTAQLAAAFLIRAWQVFSRGIFPPACRYYPSCSEYTLWAIRTYGLRHGILLGAKRLLTCHPLYKR